MCNEISSSDVKKFHDIFFLFSDVFPPFRLKNYLPWLFLPNQTCHNVTEEALSRVTPELRQSLKEVPGPPTKR